MVLHPTPADVVPPDTAAVARAVFPQGNACLRLRNKPGSIFADTQFAGLFPKTGQATECSSSAHDHAVTLVGSPPADNRWQARTEGAFTIEPPR